MVNDDGFGAFDARLETCPPGREAGSRRSGEANCGEFRRPLPGRTSLTAGSRPLTSWVATKVLLMSGVLFVAPIAFAVSPVQDPSSLEIEIAKEFPAVREKLRGEARFARAVEEVEGGPLRGFRLVRTPAPARNDYGLHPEPDPIRPSDDGLVVLYPENYGDSFVARVNAQRLVFRAVAARPSGVEIGASGAAYRGVYEGVDVLHVATEGRSEEFLVLQGPGSPTVFDYEIVSMEGIAGLQLMTGAVRFEPLDGSIWGSLEIERPYLIDSTGHRSDADVYWQVVRAESGRATTLRLTVDTRGLTYPVVVDPSFTTVGAMAGGRSYHSSTLLPNGKVLVAGGERNATSLNTAELYDPTIGTWTATGRMNFGRSRHTATLLKSGKVLVAGGLGSGGDLATAELYDPVSGTWTQTGTMTTWRSHHTATLLSNGKVLVAAGSNAARELPSAELYDPETGSWTATGSLSKRMAHTAVLLASGKVLVSGGRTGTTYLDTAYLYDPAEGTWTYISNRMKVGRLGHSATVLPNGNVLVAGGANPSPVSSAELFYVGTSTWASTYNSMTSARYGHTATLLPSGKVLVTGGDGGSGVGFLTTAELYDPSSNWWSTTTPLLTKRDDHCSTLLPSGLVLVSGGYNGSSFLTSTELYDPTAVVVAPSGLAIGARSNHTATALPNGKVLATGGKAAGSFLASSELYDPLAPGWTSTSTPLLGQRADHTATLLPSGRVLVAGGQGPTGLMSSCETYESSASSSWAVTGALSSARRLHSATLLPNGQVLVAGGEGISGDLASAEIFDPVRSTWRVTGTMTAPRSGHRATLLGNGKVLVTGGISAGAVLASADLFDPVTEIWTSIAPMATNRYRHTSTLLPNGRVLVAGGLGAGAVNLTSVELFDPVSGQWGAAPPLATARSSHAATVLPSGEVLVSGGVGGSGCIGTSERYDPARSAWIAASMSTARQLHTATVLPDGRVLIVGGVCATELSAVESYAQALGFPEARRPIVTAVTGPVELPTSLALLGSGFTGVSEGSSGATGSSASNIPLLQLQRLDNELQFFLRPSATTTFDSESWTSEWLDACALPKGHYRVTVFTGGVPSLSRIISIDSSFMAFSGLASTTQLPPPSCGYRLTWEPARVCGGAPVYNIYRSTMSGFVPSAANQIASCVAGTSYDDSGSLPNGTNIYYIVRAESATSGNGGPCRNGIEDQNALVGSGTALTCVPAGEVPNPLLVLGVTSRNQENVVQWVSPATGPISSLAIRARTDGMDPFGPADGADAGNPAAALGGKGSMVLASLTNGTEYRYGAFVRAPDGTYSGARFSLGTPFETSGRVKWTYKTGASVLTAPAVNSIGLENNLLVGSNDRVLHAALLGVSAPAGEWPRGFTPVLLNAPAQARPLVVPRMTGVFPLFPTVENAVFVGGQDGRVYAVDADTGTPIWATEVLADAIQAGLGGMFVAFGGSANRLFVATRNSGSDNSLKCLDVADGSVLWTFTGGGGMGIINGMPSIDLAAGRIYFGSRRKEAGSASTLWCVTTAGAACSSLAIGDVDGSPIVRGGWLYAGNNAGQVRRIDLSLGAVFWTFNTLDGPVKQFIWVDPAVGRIYFSTSENVWAFPTTGFVIAPLWQKRMRALGPSVPTVYNDRLYVGTLDGRLHEIDPATGATLNTLLLAPGEAIAAPTIDGRDGTAYVGSEGGRLFAVSLPLGP